MQIQVHTDNHIDGSAGLQQQVRELLEDKLRRFRPRITRLEVFFTDENSTARSADDDKRCRLEARLNGLDPVSVSQRGASLTQALGGATRKLQSLLESTLGKLEGRRSDASPE